ncbi:uncharacterized protein RB166_001098 [Leptodactylus fuscus]
MGGSYSEVYVGNDCDDKIKIYYQKSGKTHTQEIPQEVKTPGGKGAIADCVMGEDKLNILLDMDPSTQKVECDPGKAVKISDNDNVYITIVCKTDSKDELICLNMYVKTYRSLIVTKDKIVKYAARWPSEWADDDGRKWNPS